MFINNAWAQSTVPAAGTSVTGTVIQLVLILLVFYFLLIRPQQKKMKEHEAELKAIKVGDEILTGGGLYAKVTKIKDDDITAEISKGVEVKLYRYTIREVISPKPEEVKKTPEKVTKSKKK